MYYYPEVNFIVREMPTWNDEDGLLYYEKDFLKKTYYNLSEEERNTLKEINDWGRPIDEEKCIRKKVVEEGKKKSLLAIV